MIMKKKRNIGDEIIQGLEDAIAHSKGKITLNTTTVEIPDLPPELSKEEISRIRLKVLNMSQGAFAAYLGVSPAVIQSWEQGQKKPSGAARRLLQVAATSPSALLKAAASRKPSHKKKAG
jgi:putative transcriptional regulator